MSDRFKKNPSIESNFMLEGCKVTDTTVLVGEKWRKWTKSQFPGQVPKLVLAKSNAQPTPMKSTKGKDNKKPAASSKPDGTRMVLSTGSKPQAPKVKPPKAKPVPPKAKPKPALPPQPDPGSDEEDLTVLSKVGPARADALYEVGYKTVGDIRGSTPTKLVEDLKEEGTRLSMKDARAIIRSARGYDGE